MKKYIIGFVLGGIICSFITAYATETILGTNVNYDNSKSGLASTDMQNAIDELYDMATFGDAGSGNILSGKTALVNGNKVTGTIETKNDSGNATLTPSTSVVSKSYPAGYYPNAHGAQVGAVPNITPSENGTAFSEGIVKMNSSGYAYPERLFTGVFKEIAIYALVSGSSWTLKIYDGNDFLDIRKAGTYNLNYFKAIPTSSTRMNLEALQDCTVVKWGSGFTAPVTESYSAGDIIFQGLSASGYMFFMII